MRQFGVRVVCLEPGAFATEIHANAATRAASADDPYAADEAWLASFLDRAAEGADEGGAVADAIVAAVENPDTRCTPRSARRPRWRWSSRARPSTRSGCRSSCGRPRRRGPRPVRATGSH
ncbi:hypothetical protein NKH77_06245 [Streptomyces sp. M19]